MSNLGDDARERIFFDLVKEGKCPFCSKLIDITTEFKDALSKKEYGISGLCQMCQDGFFK